MECLNKRINNNIILRLNIKITWFKIEIHRRKIPDNLMNKNNNNKFISYLLMKDMIIIDQISKYHHVLASLSEKHFNWKIMNLIIIAHNKIKN